MIDLNSGRQGGIKEFTLKEIGEFSLKQSFDSEVRRLAAEKLRSDSVDGLTQIRMPDTLISNDISVVRAFIDNHHKVIVKSPKADSVAVFVDCFTLKQLSAALSQASLRFQEYVPGTAVRTYVWGNSVFNVEVYRKYNKLSGNVSESRRFVQVPRQQDLFSQTLCECLQTECATVEWRRDRLNNYYFLKFISNRFHHASQFPARRELLHLV